MHVISHPDDYPYPKGTSAAPASARPARVESLPEAPSIEAEFASLNPQQAAERLISRMSVHYRKLLSVSDLDTLRQAVMKGLLSPPAVLGEAMAAVAKLQREDFPRALRARLGQPE